ncbi:alpha/beta fold hydrolase [Microbacterium sp. ARD31]|uniref:alpha/beta hydrolase n=1 Tax=Microbacterium sp. ARD31 TaxID=2962576 RepID=UPI0028815DB2|nr:alpha/beta hydrolase [Microbacterium sp. ARD31]MDT0183051.1 alpha/beta fold hydrolase [Microbacterium sp. ARD31]
MVAARTPSAPRARVGAIIAAVLTSLVLGLGPASASAAPAGIAAFEVEPEPIERTECPVPVPATAADRVECGVLIVPERRGDDNDPERVIRIPYAVISATDTERREDPLVVPVGRPATVSAEGAFAHTVRTFAADGAWANADRDVIVIEQRGGGLSEPTLDCPEVAIDRLASDGVVASGDARGDRRLAGLQACRDRLVEDGVDLAAYTTRASAGDLADLRAALGYETWNLFAVSYDTRLALTVLRDQAAGLRALILDGPAPLHVDVYQRTPVAFAQAVDQLVASCKADAACADRYPDLDDTLAGVLEDAARSPLDVAVDSPADGSLLTVELDDAVLAQGLSDALARGDATRSLPFLIDQLDRGNVSAALPLVQRSVDRADARVEGLELSLECAEEVPFNDPAAVVEVAAGDPISAHLVPVPDRFAECEIWQVPALGDRETSPVAGEVPTLILTGTFDPLTPHRWGLATAETLPAATVALVSGAGHGTIGAREPANAGACARALARQFLADPAQDLEASCLAASGPAAFLTTADIDPTTAIYRLDRDVLEQRDPVQLGVLGVSLILLLATLVYGAVVALRSGLRLSGDIPEGGVLAAVTSAALHLGFAGILGLILVNADRQLLAFGLPPAVWPALLLPLGALVTTVLLIVLLVRAWVQDDGTLLHRILLSVSAAASLTFYLWLLLRGMLAL